MRALDLQLFQLFVLDLHVDVLVDLVALDDVVRLDLVTGLGIDLAVSDAVAGFSVELVE